MLGLQSMLSHAPRCNDIKTDTRLRIIQADKKWASRNTRVDLAYLASIWAPTCDQEALRMMIDWNHWVGLTASYIQYQSKVLTGDE